MVYTRELYREQTGQLDLAPLTINGQESPHPLRDQYARQLAKASNYVIILDEDLFSRQFTQTMLKMAQEVTLKHPDSLRVKAALESLDVSPKAFLQFTHLTPRQAQIVHDHFVKDTKIKKEYRGLESAEAFRQVRHNNADNSILSYLEYGDAATDLPTGQRKLIVLASIDGGLRKKVSQIGMQHDSIRIDVVTEYDLYKLLHEIMHTLDRHNPKPDKIPDMLANKPDTRISDIVRFIAPWRQGSPYR